MQYFRNQGLDTLGYVFTAILLANMTADTTLPLLLLYSLFTARRPAAEPHASSSVLGMASGGQTLKFSVTKPSTHV